MDGVGIEKLHGQNTRSGRRVTMGGKNAIGKTPHQRRQERHQLGRKLLDGALPIATSGGYGEPFTIALPA
jgi:hypothetical protein